MIARTVMVLGTLGLIAGACYPNPDDLRRPKSAASGGAPGVGGSSGGTGGGPGAGGGSAAGGRSGTGGSPPGVGGRLGGLGGAGGYAGAGLALNPDANGWIDKATNAYGVQGSWYGFSDGIGPDGLTSSGSCERAGHLASECSAITSPSPSTPGFPNTGGRMCTTGVAARVVANRTTGLLDYGAIYGAAIGFDFNFDPVLLVKGKLNALAAGLTGIAFDIDVIPDNGLRVQMVTPGTDFGAGGPAYWGANPGFPASPVVVGTNRIYWADFMGPYGQGLDPTQLVAMYFAVPTQAISMDSFHFCISNVKLIKDAGPPGRTCTSAAFPIACPASNGVAAGCWSPGVNCNSLVSCSGQLHSCLGQAPTDYYDCALGRCVTCTAPNSTGCPARGSVPAQCWAPGTACSTVTYCAGLGYVGCQDPSLTVDCFAMACF